jgi:hypothetical protein
MFLLGKKIIEWKKGDNNSIKTNYIKDNLDIIIRFFQVAERFRMEFKIKTRHTT